MNYGIYTSEYFLSNYQSDYFLAHYILDQE